MIERINEDFFRMHKPNKVPVWVYLFFLHIISVIVISFAIPYFSIEKEVHYSIGIFIWAILTVGWKFKFNMHYKSINFKEEENKRQDILKEVLSENNMTKQKDIIFLYKLADKKTKKKNVFKFAGTTVLIFFLLNPIYTNFLNTFFNGNILNQFVFASLLFIPIIVFLLLYSSLLDILNNSSQFIILKNDLGNIRLEMKTKKLELK